MCDSLDKMCARKAVEPFKRDRLCGMADLLCDKSALPSKMFNLLCGGSGRLHIQAGKPHSSINLPHSKSGHAAQKEDERGSISLLSHAKLAKMWGMESLLCEFLEKAHSASLPTA